ncbi:MAG: FAD/NAD(P)-binding protein [Chloroflexi bacterium]|nr:FAD/NAD(P)-binding protein [Chloroflexota bacterium]
MAEPGTRANPLRVAIIGAGPSAFYAADHLLKQEDLNVEIDMFDRLPTPYGLVRAGVAPDHQKIKTVTRAFARTATDPRFRFFGYVEFGRDISLDDIRRYYHQVLFATGAQSDKHMGIPGEGLRGSHPATEFVAWYNGHPDYRDCSFDLSCEQAVIVGVGNVAIDVARILSLTPAELARTDMADHAIAALSASKVRDVYLLGRRGPAQAAFTNPELKELGELAEADVIIRPDEAALDPLSQADLARDGDRALARKVEMIQSYAARPPAGLPRRLHLRFLVSPTELHGDANGHVSSVSLVRNRLTATATGSLVAEPTGETEEIAAGLVLRSVGYRGLPLPGIPFHDRWGVILNAHGRVLDPGTNAPIPGEYVTGWIKRGPTGVIGTNKPDSVETATAMLEDAREGTTFAPGDASCEAIAAFVRGRQPQCVTFDDWRRLDELEVAAGGRAGRPRVKFTSIEDMLRALGR